MTHNGQFRPTLDSDATPFLLGTRAAPHPLVSYGRGRSAPADTMHQGTLIEAAVIRAASLQYTCDSLDPEDDAILSTCDSFKCGGQVEPTASSLEFLWVSCVA